MPAYELDDHRKALLVAALFHDIGKFQYRAQRTTVYHTETAADFVRDNLGRFSALHLFVDTIAEMVREHHAPEADANLQQADHLAASERREERVDAGRRYLTSVFASVNIGKNPPAEKHTYTYRPGPLGSEVVFPEQVDVPTSRWVPPADDVLKDHEGAWKDFLNELRTVPASLDFHGLLTTLYALLERWTARVSSAAYRSVPDISLFDHLRTTAALADCLTLAEDPEQPFLLVQGDIGGIQNFIYRLRTPEDSKGMSKQLRGRSFYVGLLNDTLARWILNELGLFLPNLLVSGGGHFLLLAPNGPTSVESLRQCRVRANQWLLREFHFDLSLVLEWLPLSREEMQNFDDALSRIAGKIAEAKTHRAVDLLDDERLFGPAEDVREELVICPICQSLVPKPGSGGEGLPGNTCPACRLHWKIGAVMPRLHWMVNLASQATDLPLSAPKQGLVYVPFEEFGQVWVLVPGQEDASTTHLASELEAVLGAFHHLEGRLEVLRVGQSYLDPVVMDHFAAKRSSAQVGFGFRFLATALPKKDGELLSFEKIARKGEAYPYLAFFRADVDNLGFIFAAGLQEDRTIGRYATLSRELDLFFTAYVDKLAREHDIYITYSGGDDLFAIGNWAKVVDFARQLQADFERLTCRNPNFGLSGGIFITHPSHPVGLAAYDAQECEDRAKRHRGKNALCLFDTVHSWPRVQELLEYGEKLKEISSENHAYRSLVRYILELWQRTYGQGHGEVDLHQLGYLRPHLYYALARRAGVTARALETKPDDPAVATFGVLLREEALLRDFSLPARYALLMTRQWEKKAKAEEAKQGGERP